MRGTQGKVETFGEALSGLVPMVEALAVKSGEDAGDISGGLRRAGDIARLQQQVNQAIRGELAYPIFLLLLLGILLTAMSSYVLPIMGEILDEARWPPQAQAVAQFSRWTPFTLGVASVLLIGGGLGFLHSRSRWIGRFRDWCDQYLFPFTLYRRTTGALMLASLSALIRIGIPFSLALERLAEIGGAWERQQLMRIRNRLRRGEREGAALAIPLFDAQLRWQLELYGKLSRFSEAMETLSTRVIDHTQAQIRFSFSLVRTLLLVTIAGLILWIYSAFMAITLAARTVAG